MSKSRKQEPERPDLSFYTELRYPGTAEEIVSSFTGATRELLRRLADDLRSERRGEFGGGNEGVLGALAVAADRLVGHVDVLEEVLLGTPASESGDVLRNVFANVVSDANLVDLAQGHVGAPKQNEAKFDQGKGGKIAESTIDVADKAKDIGDAFPPVKAGLGIAAIILRDVGIIGKLAAEESGGNQATKQLEAKLDRVLPQLAELLGGQQGITSGVQRVEGTLDQTRREVFKIEQKADILGDLLGKTLVGDGWIVDPLRTRDRPNRTPARSVKDELHDLERLIRELIDRLGPVTDGPVPPPPPPPPPPPFDEPRQPPPEEPPPVLEDWRLKKIFVYAENVFAPTSRTERRTINVRTGAFDLSGWLDLSRLRPGDEVEVTVRASFAGRRNVRYRTTRFDSPGLKHFAEFAGGRDFIVGNDVQIVLRQPRSADQFATPIEHAYQFVVESQ
jgi:hypothetical protein